MSLRELQWREYNRLNPPSPERRRAIDKQIEAGNHPSQTRLSEEARAERATYILTGPSYREYMLDKLQRRQAN